VSVASAIKENLLVVDYEPGAIDSIKSALSGEGYEVFCAQSSQEALSIIQKKMIDLLITGLPLPGLSGPELLQQAHLISPSTGMIIMCQHDSMDALMKSVKAGAQAIVFKPIDAQQLKAAVEDVLQKTRLAKENIRLKTLLPLFEVNKSIVSELNASKTFNRIVRVVCIETRADKVSLMLLNEVSNELVVRAALGLSKTMVGRSMQLPHDDISWSVVKTGRAILLNAKPKHVVAEKDPYITSSLCVPLSMRGKVIGVINCSKNASRIPFTESDLELLTILAGQAAVAIENAKLFDDIQVHKDNAETFLTRILTAQEDERKRISTELHDGLAQWLVSASYATQLGSTFISLSRFGEAQEEICRASKILEQSIRELRRIVLDLHPTALAELGLVRALQQNIECLGKENGIRVKFDIGGCCKQLSLTQDIAIYRICLEALNNVRKHACASNVEVNLSFDTNCVSLEIADDGRGFDLTEIVKNGFAERSIGLISMKERAEMIGGKLEINTASGKGTRVLLRVPMCPPTPSEQITGKIQS
jgi:signal transduction histidine kinase